MKTVHLNINEMSGGASKAAHRLHTGLLQQGIDSQMAVLRKSSKDPSVSVVPMTRLQQAIRRRTLRFERPSRKRYPNYQNTPWSVGWFSTPVSKYVNRVNPDIVHLHWIGDGFISIEEISQINRPMIWTLHDMWALTGGCHYSGGCERYRQMCGACPQLGSTQVRDLSRWTWTQKRRYWLDLNLTLVSPSQWLAECVQSSWLLGGFRVEVIPNGIDLNIYHPLNQTFSREVLGLPLDKKLILFGAYRVDDKRKGFQHLLSALHNFSEHDDVELVVFGESQMLPSTGLRIHDVGSIQDDRVLALLYSAVDVFVAPSEEDNLPNTVMEAMACGTPSVAFRVGGLPDMVEHQQNGYLAEPFDPVELAYGIRWVLADETRLQALGQQARLDAEERFDLKKIASRYVELYTELNQ